MGNFTLLFLIQFFPFPMSLIQNYAIFKNGVVSRGTCVLLIMEDSGFSMNIAALAQDSGHLASIRKVI